MLAIFFVLFEFVPYKQLLEMYQSSHKGYLLLAFAIFAGNYIIGVFRWRFLLSRMGIVIPSKEVLYVYFSGLFLNLFFPSFVAGDIFRGVSISYRYGDSNKVASSVLMDRFSGAVAIAFIAIAAVCTGWDIVKSETSVFICLLILLGAIGIASLLIFTKTFFNFSLFLAGKSERLRKKLISFHNQLYFFKKQPEVFFKSLLFSLPLQALTIVGFFIAAKAFLVKVSIADFFVIVPIIAAIATIPITPAGAGTRDAAAVYFFSLIGIARSIGLSISLLNLINAIAMGLVGGIVYVGVYHRYLARR